MKNFNQKPGEWFNLSKICFTLKVIQNKFPMKGTQNLQILYFDQCFNPMPIFLLENINICKCQKFRMFCQNCHFSKVVISKKQRVVMKGNNGLYTYNNYKESSDKYNDKSTNVTPFNKLEKGKQKINCVSLQQPGFYQQQNMRTNYIQNKSLHAQQQKQEYFMTKRFKRDIYIMMLARITTDKQNINLLNNTIFKLLDLPFCLGIMTGFPKQAIFIIGREDKKLIYLNPHYVQQTNSISNMKKGSYFCEDYLLTTVEQLDPSMSFCFYLQCFSEMKLLYNTINQASKNNCLSIMANIGYNKDFKFQDHQEEEDEQEMSSFISNVSIQSKFQDL